VLLLLGFSSSFLGAGGSAGCTSSLGSGTDILQPSFQSLNKVLKVIPSNAAVNKAQYISKIRVMMEDSRTSFYDVGSMTTSKKQSITQIMERIMHNDILDILNHLFLPVCFVKTSCFRDQR
jgi:hypothetical protein